MTPLEAWYREFMMKHGEPPDMSPTANYDYALAMQYGIQPKRAADGFYHWPSKTPDGQWLKKEGHPTAWKEDYAGLLGAIPEGLPQEWLIYRALRGGSR